MDKPTKISNTHLNDDILFINWYLLFAAYAPVAINYNNEKRDDDNKIGSDNKTKCLNVLSDKNRMLSDRTCRILINSEFLNMDKELLIYCFLLQKLNNKIINEKISYSNLQVEISLKEIQKFFSINQYKNATLGHAFKTALLRLRGVTLQLDIKGEKECIITGLINEIVYQKGNSAKTTYKITFPEHLIKFLERSKRETFFTLEEYKSIETFGAKKIYFYLNSIDYKNKDGFTITEFKRSTLEQVLGHSITYLNFEDESESHKYEKHDDVSKKDIKDYLNALVKYGFLITWSYDEKTDNYTIRQTRHKKELKREDKQRELNKLEINSMKSLEKSISNNNISIVVDDIEEDNSEQLSQFLERDEALDTREDWEKVDDIDLSPGSLEEIPFLD